MPLDLRQPDLRGEPGALRQELLVLGLQVFPGVLQVGLSRGQLDVAGGERSPALRGVEADEDVPLLDAGALRHQVGDRGVLLGEDRRRAQCPQFAQLTELGRELALLDLEEHRALARWRWPRGPVDSERHHGHADEEERWAFHRCPRGPGSGPGVNTTSRKEHSSTPATAMAARTRGSHRTRTSSARSRRSIVATSAPSPGWQPSSVKPEGSVDTMVIRRSTVMASGYGTPLPSWP